MKECKKFVDEIEEDKKKSQTLLENKKETEDVDLKQTLDVTKNKSYNINQNIKEEVKQSDERKKIQEAFGEEDVKYKNSTISQENFNVNKNNPEPIKPSSKIEKLKEVVEKEVKTESTSNNDKKQKDDILIEENQGLKTNSTNSQQSKYIL